MKPNIWSILAAVSLLASVGANAQPRAEPVPATMIKGDRLEPPGLGFSLQLPSPKWAWMHLVGSQENNFEAVDIENNRVFTILVQPQGPLTEASARGFMAGMKEGNPARGTFITNTTLEKSSIPRPGSYRFTAVAAMAGATVYLTGYLVDLPNRGLGTFQEIRTEPGESPDFTAFVSSLRIIDPGPSPSSPLTCLLYVPFWAIVIGICLLINRFLGRPAINPGRVALVTCFVVMAVDIGIVYYFMARGPAISGFVQGELMGEAVGKSLIPLALSAVFSNRFSRKHRQSSQADTSLSSPGT